MSQRHLAWGVALLVGGATGCSFDSVELEGRTCPCAEGWVCVASQCYRPGDAPDAGLDGGRTDVGPEEVDAGDDLGTDADVTDGSVDLGGDEDGGPDLGAEPVDCSPLADRADTELCGATASTCSAEAQNNTTCDALCGAVELVCLEAYDDLSSECGPNLDSPTTCDDATKMIYHCLCIRG
jgi:hypothetical protein